MCGQEFPRKAISIDHIDPVGYTPGSKLAPPDLTWGQFIARLFCSPDNLGTICETDHREKTNREIKERFRRLRELTDNAPIEAEPDIRRDGTEAPRGSATGPGVD